MSIIAPKNTLAYQLKGRPLTQPLPVSGNPVGAMAEKAIDFHDSLPTKGASYTPSPESEALWFYLYEHAMHALSRKYRPEEPLSDAALSICERYHREQSQVALRSLYYLLLITTREARHTGQKYAAVERAKKVYGFDPGSVLSVLDQAQVHTVCGAIKNSCPSAPVGAYMTWLSEVFAAGGFSGGFGGKPWSNIAKCAAQFLTGQTSLVLMTDISWSLAHNNGPIFNKGMLYSSYGPTPLLEVLDTQRAGMIPAFIRQCRQGVKYAARKHVTPGMNVFCDRVYEATADPSFAPDTVVDWGQVKNLGALGSYHGPVYEGGTPADPPNEKKAKVPPVLSKKPEASPDTHLVLMPGIALESIPSPRQKKKEASHG